VEYQIVDLVYNKTFLDAVLAAELTVPGGALIPTPTVMLFNLATLNPAPDTLIATFTANKCTFSGYADQALTLAGPRNTGPQSLGNIGNVIFSATAATPFVPDTAYGWAILSGGDWIAAGKFDAPFVVPFQAAGDFLSLLVQLFLQEYQQA
jgi:hypothetical protein